MKLVLLADLHDAATDVAGSARRSAGARAILRRAVRRINRHIRPDLVVLAGDLLENGCAPDAPERYAALREILDGLEVPWLAVPGNHDAPTDTFYRYLPRPAGHTEAGGARVVCFTDPPAPYFCAERLPADLARSESAGVGASGPVIALQHVPLFPRGATPCPYNFENAEAALESARKGGISLILSGHYHKGLPLTMAGGIALACSPALCEAPFRFLEIELEPGKPPRETVHALQMPEVLGAGESHVHTELAYCADGITVEAALAAGRFFGAGPMRFAEHTGQLYFDEETFWAAAFMREGLGTGTGRANRMADYSALMARHGLTREQIGFETDFDFNGRMVLSPEDRARAGFLLGSLHWTPETAARFPFDPALCEARLRTAWEPMLASGIDVLAHPFRLFKRSVDRPSRALCRHLASRLAATGVAAELNYHNEKPEPDFVLACLDAGVRLSLGSDSHRVDEVSDFWPHLQLLRSFGVSDSDLDRILWRPRPAPA